MAEMSTEILYVAIILVLFTAFFLSVYSKISPDAVRDDFRERLYAVDVGLSLDSAQAVPPDTNFLVSYGFPNDLNLLVRPQRVLVWKDDVDLAEGFSFALNTDFVFGPSSFELLASDSRPFYINRAGRSLVVSKQPPAVQDTVFCADPVPLDAKVSVSAELIPVAARYLVDSAPESIFYADRPSGGIFVGFMLRPELAPDGVMIYVKDDDVSRNIGCFIMRAYLRDHQFSSVNVVPVNPEILPDGDYRRLLGYGGHNVIVAFVPALDSAYMVGETVAEGLRDYGII